MRVLDNKHPKAENMEPCAETSSSQEEIEKMRTIEKQLLLNSLKMLDIY